VTWTIRVLNWREFQHYTGREPPWIKLHRRLLQKPAWRRLDGGAAKLLVDLWMLAAGTKEGELDMPLADLAYHVRLSEADTWADLQAVAAGGFVQLADTMQAPASTTLAKADPEESRGEQRESRETPILKSAAAPPDRVIAATANPMTVLGPLIREHLYIPDGQPPEGHNPNRCASIVKALLERKYSVDDLREAILIVPMVRAGKVTCDDTFRRFFLKAGKVTMRALNDRWGSGLVLDQLLHLARKQSPVSAIVRDVGAL